MAEIGAGCETDCGGQHAAMARSDAQRGHGALGPLALVTAAALVFAVLLVLVRLQWPPLESADHEAATGSNGLIAGHHAVISVIKTITLLGSSPVLWSVIGATALVLLLRRQWRLAAFVIAAGGGAIALGPVLKVLVGRLRPVLAHPVAHAPGNSFPSGHALGSIACYGALLLVFLPAARGRWRTVLISVVAALVAVIGVSRILLGVHYVSDVVGAWAIGICWLGLTAVAFELARPAAGLPVVDPLSEGLEPEARDDLRPARPAPAVHHRGRMAAALLVAWALIVALVVALGDLITRDGHGNVLGDRTVPRWFAAHRTAAGNTWSEVFSTIGSTPLIIAVAVAGCLIFLAVTRRWRPVRFLAIVMCGELGAFLIAAAVVMRVRPDVPRLDSNIPTSSYPSGHEAATCCLYIALAILIIGRARGWWRWLALVPAIALPVLVAISRLYRGEHHPTDIAASLLLSALWLTAATWLTKPNASPGSSDPGRGAQTPATEGAQKRQLAHSRSRHRDRKEAAVKVTRTGAPPAALTT
jgi:undecaprenyl-diphosphatase